MKRFYNAIRLPLIARVSIALLLAMPIALSFPSPQSASADTTIAIAYTNARQFNDVTGQSLYNKTVAQLIAEEASEHNINPRLILITLQKESSAVTSASPSSDTTRTWPMFYNYDERMAACINGDANSCNDTKYSKPTYEYRAYNYGGVGQQIAYATAQLRNLADNASYCGGNLTVSVDGQSIATENAGTCALYKYTPHLVSYGTSSSFYLNWQSWWSTTPNGGAYSAANTISPTNFSNSAPTMSTDEINNFLVSKGSWLANYTIPEYISVAYPIVQTTNPTPTPAPTPVYKTGDVNRDNRVDLLDLSILASYWNHTSPGEPRADVNGDGKVDLLDLSLLAANWDG